MKRVSSDRKETFIGLVYSRIRISSLSHVTCRANALFFSFPLGRCGRVKAEKPKGRNVTMSDLFRSKFNRRGVLKSSMAAMAGGLLSRYGMEKAAAESEPAVKNVNLNSSPSTLKITDMRYAIIVKPGPSPCPIIRIDTNQGVYGLGEVRDGASPTYALFLKSRIVGENPLQLDWIFRKIKQFGGHARQGR